MKHTIDLQKFNKNDFKILKVLESSPNPLPPTTLVFLTKLRNDKISQRLKQLERYGFVKIVYKRTLPFYTINGDKND